MASGDDKQALIVHRRVLVVDDNVDGAHALSLLLKHLGADVRVAHGGDDALHELSSFEATLVFLDIVMPGMDGYEVARRIRTASRIAEPLLRRSAHGRWSAIRPNRRRPVVTTI